jgi:FG-GAP repeat
MTQTAKLTASHGKAFDTLGEFVSISGNTVIAGAPFASIHGNFRQGAAYVFTRPASGWVNATQSTKLIAAGGASNDYLGFSVSVDGNIAVAGAPATVGGNPGAAYVFLRPAVTR